MSVENSSVEWGHVQRTIDEENGRLATALTGVRLATAKAVRWRNIVLVKRGDRGGEVDEEKGKVGKFEEMR